MLRCQVCDASKGAIFNPSPNDPTSGTCLLPNGANSRPVNLFQPGQTLWLNMTVCLFHTTAAAGIAGSIWNVCWCDKE